MNLIKTGIAFALLSGGSLAAADLFEKQNLAAWCIVPYDGKKRGPDERAAMLKNIGLHKFVYDFRREHFPQMDDEMLALKKHGIQLLGWWFPTRLNDDARRMLEIIKRHKLKPQWWVSGNGGPIEVKDERDQAARIAAEVERLKPICEAAAEIGCQVGVYNHGNWYGEPENAVAIVQELKAQGFRNVGIVYNLHHGHDHLGRMDQVLQLLRPHLICLNLNGMDREGVAQGRKILPIGVGAEDLRVLRQIAASGYSGPIGIINHTDEDAEARLLDNLDGLAWLVGQIRNEVPTPAPRYRTNVLRQP
jgi:(2Fe-2S) ferredoxin